MYERILIHYAFFLCVFADSYVYAAGASGMSGSRNGPAEPRPVRQNGAFRAVPPAGSAHPFAGKNRH